MTAADAISAKIQANILSFRICWSASDSKAVAASDL
jgi:hypothetical protein